MVDVDHTQLPATPARLPLLLNSAYVVSPDPQISIILDRCGACGYFELHHPSCSQIAVDLAVIILANSERSNACLVFGSGDCFSNAIVPMSR